MEENFVLTGNKLIAEFMDIKLSNEWKDGLDYASDNVWGFNDEYYDCKHPNLLGFHTSWDWLMPVVEKIMLIKVKTPGSKAYNRNDRGFGLYGNKFLVNHSLKYVYGSVIEFIEWYNKEKN